VRNSGRRSIHIAWRSGCCALLDQVECVLYVNNVDDTKVIGTFHTFLCCVVASQRPSGREHLAPSTTHTHTQHILAGERKKQFLCACGERGFRHKYKRERKSERGREKKWISIPSMSDPTTHSWEERVADLLLLLLLLLLVVLVLVVVVEVATAATTTSYYY
jgi:hypothetical protein